VRTVVRCTMDPRGRARRDRGRLRHRSGELRVPDAAGAMTSVTAFGAGFVAAGYRDDPLDARASAAVWRSNDGLVWNTDGGSGNFGGGRIWGIAAKWTSSDGLAWMAAPDQSAFHDFLMPVRMQSVMAGPTGLIAGRRP
jgi:hypothetical protein